MINDDLTFMSKSRLKFYEENKLRLHVGALNCG